MFGFGKNDSSKRRSEAVGAAYKFIEQASPEVVMALLNFIVHAGLGKNDPQAIEAEQGAPMWVEAAKTEGRGSEPNKELRKMALTYWAGYLANTSMTDFEDKRTFFEGRLKEIS